MNRIKAFEIYLPASGSRIQADTATTEEIRQWSDYAQKQLREELESVVPRAFPKMSSEEQEEYVGAYFKLPGSNFQREGVLLREASGKLIAAGLFDQGEIDYRGKSLITGYSLLRAILPEYQGAGIGQTLSAKVLTDFQPDIFFANTYQSSSFHAWADLPQKGLVSGFDVYPRFETVNGEEILVTVPFKKLDFIISAFRQTYLRFIEKPEIVEKEVRNLTIFMVRKDNHGELYDFDPWQKNGREDKIAKTLGATYKDGIMVIFIKKAD
jgi:hypothetical protein